MRSTSSAALIPLLLAIPGCCDFKVEDHPHESIANVIRLDWETDEPGVSWVEYGLDKDYGMVTSISEEAGTSHTAFLLGLPPLSEVHWKAITEVDGEEMSCDGKTETNGLPSDLPDMLVTTYEPDKVYGDYVIGTAFGTVPCVFVVDREGEWLWYQRIDGRSNPVEIEFEDGTNNVLYNSFLTDHEEDEGYIHRVSFGLDVSDDIRTELAHHSFTQLPDGSLAYMAIDVRDYDVTGKGEEPVVGDAVEVITPEGDQYTLFSSWEWAEPYYHDRWDGGFYPQGGDWTHGNSITYYEGQDGERDTMIISFRNYDGFIEIYPDSCDESGACEVKQSFAIDGDKETWTFADEEESFAYQHDPNWTPDGTLLMMSTEDGTRQTMAAEYALDEATGTMERIWTHGDGENIYVVVQGTARVLPNGNRMINFGSAGVVRELDPNGDIVWEMVALAGTAYGNTLPFDDFYDVHGEPD